MPRSPKPDTHGAASKRPGKAHAGLLGQRLAFATQALEQRGVLSAKPTRKVSARLNPGLMEAARLKLGAASDTEVLTAALTVLAGGDDFGAWLVSRAGHLPKDFELGF